MGAPVDKDDLRSFRDDLVELFDAKLDRVDERVTGLRNWFLATMAVNVTAILAAKAGAPGTGPIRSALAVIGLA